MKAHSNSKFLCRSITSGCSFVYSRDGGILIGCVSEAIKYLAGFGLEKIPLRAIVLSDTAHAHGISNWALEFPVYKHLFVDDALAENRKLIVVGTKKQVARMKAILQIALFGPTRNQFKKWAKQYEVPGFCYRMLEKAARVFAIKSGDEPCALEELIDFRVYDAAHEVSLGALNIYHRGEDCFIIYNRDKTWSKKIALTFAHRPKPPFELVAQKNVNVGHRFAFQVLLNSNGFDHENGCTAYVVWINGRPVLWDAGPFVHECMRANGLDNTNIGGVIVTHIHDDHSSLLEVMASGKSIKLYATPEVYEGLLIKIGALIDRDLQKPELRESFLKLLDFQPIYCGQEVDIFGVKFYPHYSIHSIPTIGGRFVFQDRGRDYRFLITGDTVGPQKLNELESQKLISQRWIEEARSRVQGNEDLVLYDGGGDAAGLHADPSDPELMQLAHTMGERLLFGHRSQPEARNGARINVAKPGYKKVFVKSTQSNTDIAAIAQAFKGYRIPSLTALSEIYVEGSIRECKPHETVVRQGAASDKVYVLTAGLLEVVQSGKFATTLSPGTIFGEMGALDNQPRCATIRCLSAARLFQIEKTAFVRFVEKHGLKHQFENLWTKRNQLRQTDTFQCLPNLEIEKLAQELEQIFYPAGSRILEQGELGDEAYVLTEGSVRVVRDGRTLAKLARGNIIGEKAALNAVPTERSATVEAIHDSYVLQIRGERLRELNNEFFTVNDALYTTLAKRSLLKAEVC